MELDLHESVPNRNVELEERLLTNLKTSYKDKYLQRIRKLDGLKTFVEDNSFNGVKAGHHIMYKLVCDAEGHTELLSKDGNRAYEFLIEFDLEDVAYGIYYGCRGLIKGGDQEEQIARLQSEWDDVLFGETCNVLNNTFVDKEFSGRFQKTNNANNRTYWPFWLSLYEDEDVVDVAALAVRLIFNVYKRYLVDGIVPETKRVVPKSVDVRTRCTQDAFDGALSLLDHESKQLMFDSAKAKAVFKRFIRMAVKEGRNRKQGLIEDTNYEKCWRFYRIRNVQAGFLFAELTERMGVRKNNETVPWRYIPDNFLSEKGEPMENIRQSYVQTSVKKGDEHKAWAKQYLDRILG